MIVAAVDRLIPCEAELARCTGLCLFILEVVIAVEGLVSSCAELTEIAH